MCRAVAKQAIRFDVAVGDRPSAPRLQPKADIVPNAWLADDCRLYVEFGARRATLGATILRCDRQRCLELH